MSRLEKAEAHLKRLASVPATLIRAIELAEEEMDRETRALITDGIGARIQACYTGLEALMEATLGLLQTEAPSGNFSHKALLDLAEARALISADERSALDAIKGFRHIHRHAYDMVLDYDILKARALSLADVLPPILSRTEKILAASRD